jgi:hypothetical protein
MAPPPLTPPVPLFPPKPTVGLRKDMKLDDAVNAAVKAVVDAEPGKPAAKFSLTLIDLNGDRYGVFNDNQEHYAASAVKIAVMYAAYALFGMVKRYNDLRAPSSPKALFDGLRAEMNTPIEQSSVLIRGGVTAQYRLPSYEKVFAPGKMGSKLLIRFHPSFEGAMSDMIVLSKNERTAECIHGIGYSYLNGVLENGGFFKPADKKGVWLAGDYTGAWPYVRIPSDNDIDTAQGATSLTLAHLMAVIFLDNNLLGASHIEMNKLLKRAAFASWFLAKEVSNRLVDTQVTHAKIGVGPMKKKMGGHDVYSEATVLKGIERSGRYYVAAFTNVDYKPYAIDHVLAAIKDAVKRYEH